MKQNWEYKKLGDVCEVIMGQSPASDTYNDSNGLPFFQGNADFGKEHPEVRVFCSSPIKIAQPNDILISVRAPIGAINIADCECCIGRGLAAIRAGSSISNRYVYRLLIASRNKLIAQGTGSTFKSIGRSILASLTFPVPPMSEQSRIVAELDLLTGIIDKQKAQLKGLDCLAQSIFYDIFGDPIENPKGWDVMKLGDICVIERGGSPRPIEKFITDDPNGLNWIKIGDAVDGSKYITSTKEKIKPEGLKKTRLVHKGDFILSNSMSFGRPYILGIDGCIHDGWLVIHDKNNLFDKSYLYYLLASPSMYQEFKRLAVGGVVSNLNSDLVRSVFVAIPPLTLQQEFADKIAAIENQKSAINRSMADTQKLLDYTMDKYFG